MLLMSNTALTADTRENLHNLGAQFGKVCGEREEETNVTKL